MSFRNLRSSSSPRTRNCGRMAPPCRRALSKLRQMASHRVRPCSSAFLAWYPRPTRASLPSSELSSSISARHFLSPASGLESKWPKRTICPIRSGTTVRSKEFDTLSSGKSRRRADYVYPGSSPPLPPASTAQHPVKKAASTHSAPHSPAAPAASLMFQNRPTSSRREVFSFVPQRSSLSFELAYCSSSSPAAARKCDALATLYRECLYTVDARLILCIEHRCHAMISVALTRYDAMLCSPRVRVCP